MFRSQVTFIALLLLVIGCSEVNTSYELPVLGRSDIVPREENGKTTYDTIPHTIGEFAFLNQDSSLITNESLNEKIYVADFFFTSCPTICPKMKQQMLRLYQEFETDNDVMLVSHTIDPTYDTVGLLKEYAARLEVSSKKWHFLTGEKDKIYDLGEESYMSVMAEDEDAPGGFIHSGAFILVDKQRRIRGAYDGTMPEQVDILIKDIKRLKKEDEAKS